MGKRQNQLGNPRFAMTKHDDNSSLEFFKEVNCSIRNNAEFYRCVVCYRICCVDDRGIHLFFVSTVDYVAERFVMHFAPPALHVAVFVLTMVFDV